MKIELSISFRKTALEIALLLPPDLKFLAPKLKDSRLGTSSWSFAVVSQSQLQRVISWGRQEQEGKSIIYVAAIHEIYDVTDLDEMSVVEIFPTTHAGYFDTSNKYDAFTAAWDCKLCCRMIWKQVLGLKMQRLPKTDFGMSETYDWLVSQRTVNKLEEMNLEMRPLLNSNTKMKYFQLVMPPACEIELNMPPVHLEDVCQICGRPQIVLAEDRIEGEAKVLDDNYPGITICKMPPFNIRVKNLSAFTLAQSPTDFGHFQCVPKNRPHTVGEWQDWNKGGLVKHRPYWFAHADIVRALLEDGISGLAFRPASALAP